jgi:hypothetical protein
MTISKAHCYGEIVRYVILVIVSFGILYALMEVLSQPAEHSAPIIDGAGREPGVHATPVASRFVLPAEEQGFIEAVQESQIAFQSAPNEMAAGGFRFRRGVAICRALPTRTVSNWVGRIAMLESNGDGKGVLKITLADDISVETWNNELSDIGDHTLIEPASALFAAVSQMKVGDQVLFSGTFLNGDNDVDCVRERSLSLHGSMRDPDFMFRFADVTQEAPPVSTSVSIPPTQNDEMQPQPVDKENALAPPTQSDEVQPQPDDKGSAPGPRVKGRPFLVAAVKAYDKTLDSGVLLRVVNGNLVANPDARLMLVCDAALANCSALEAGTTYQLYKLASDDPICSPYTKAGVNCVQVYTGTNSGSIYGFKWDNGQLEVQ